MMRIGNAFWLMPLTMIAGCLHWGERIESNSATPQYQVKCGGECLELNKRSASEQHALLRKVDELLKETRNASFTSLVEREAESVLLILDQFDHQRAATDSELKLASEIDLQLKHPDGDGWRARLQSRGRGKLKSADDALRHAEADARKQQWTKTIVLLQRNQTATAPFPFQSIRASLLLAEAHRKIGNADAAALAWQHAARSAAQLPPRFHVPNLWERIATERPVSTDWPIEVASTIAEALPTCLAEEIQSKRFVTEALVWYQIGNSRLQRSDASGALSAFKNAVSHGTFPQWDEFLLLHQAKALLAMQQAPTATSLLTSIVDRAPTSPWRLPALTLLGSGKLAEGHTQQALAFLREAVESSEADFFWRADAEANLGLAYLSSGDQANGLKRLHAAHQRFRTHHDGTSLIQCLENEANYWRHIGNAENARKMSERIRECETGNKR